MVIRLIPPVGLGSKLQANLAGRPSPNSSPTNKASRLRGPPYDDAVELVLFAFKNASPGDIFVQKAPAATVEILAKAVCSRLGVDGHDISTIGTRHGEKLFEVLLSREEMGTAQDLGNYYKIPADTRDLNYGKFVEAGSRDLAHLNEYSSHNTHRLSLDEMKDLLDKIDLSPAGDGVY